MVHARNDWFLIIWYAVCADYCINLTIPIVTFTITITLGLLFKVSGLVIVILLLFKAS